jgi:hypothetical protein
VWSGSLVVAQTPSGVTRHTVLGTYRSDAPATLATFWNTTGDGFDLGAANGTKPPVTTTSPPLEDSTAAPDFGWPTPSPCCAARDREDELHEDPCKHVSTVAVTRESENRLIDAAPALANANGRVMRRERLGDLLNLYHRAAA